MNNLSHQIESELSVNPHSETGLWSAVCRNWWYKHLIHHTCPIMYCLMHFSCFPTINARAWIARMVEHQTFNLRVQGSSPCSGELFLFLTCFPQFPGDSQGYWIIWLNTVFSMRWNISRSRVCELVVDFCSHLHRSKSSTCRKSKYSTKVCQLHCLLEF